MSRHFARRTLAPLLLALALAAAWPTAAAGDCTTPPKPARLAPATVERVSDGDTVILRLPDGRRKRTRLIGIDAPEIHDNQKLQRDATRTAQDHASIQALGLREHWMLLYGNGVRLWTVVVGLN
jgi:endonuclease YncB( thermonuclease family)